MSEIFNQEALDALEERSEAEEMARVASPKLRLVLGAMVALMLVVVYWCIFGTINYKVKAQGIVFPFSEAVPLSAPYDGTVARCMVKPSSSVIGGTAVLMLMADTVGPTAKPLGTLASVVLADTLMADTVGLATKPLDIQVSPANPQSTVASVLAREGGEDVLSVPFDTIVVPCDGVVISTPPIGTDFKVGEPMAWLLPQAKEMAGREMLCYVPYNDLRKLRVGQQVQVTPANMEREEWGYAYGHLVGIEQYPMTQQEIVDRLKFDALAAFITDGQAMCEVRVALDIQGGDLVWSREKSREVKMGNGVLCNIQVIAQKAPVWRVLIGAVDNAIQSVAGN